MKPDWKFSLAEAQSRLPDDATQFRFHYALRHGSLKVGLYAPTSDDIQGPHRQDELYIVISGSGDIVKNGERSGFGPQDVIFVEAGASHRFENFTDDFQTWVMFWGVEGGERATLGEQMAHNPA